MSISKSHAEQVLSQLERELGGTRVAGKAMLLSQDQKTLICQLRGAGLTTTEIQARTGVYPSAICQWMKKLSAGTRRSPAAARKQVISSHAPKRHIKILTVANSAATAGTVTFKFANGRITADVPIAQLSADLVKVLTSC